MELWEVVKREETYGEVLGLRDVEVNNDRHDATPDAEDNISLPPDGTKNNRPSIVVEDTN
jgi:hypothetical protein